MDSTGKTKDRRGLTGKLMVVALIGGLLVAFWVLGLGRYLTLSHLKTSADAIKAFYAGHPVLMVLGYFLVYVATTSLSLPGAAVLTIAGGALFGLLTGTVIVSFASSIGATIACFVSRYLLRAWAQNALGGRIAKIDEGIEKEGAFYLFTLSLIISFALIGILPLAAKKSITLYRERRRDAG
jgi:uncharacterized membrane protein YdjX (TVP38/TMEM64 family)